MVSAALTTAWLVTFLMELATGNQCVTNKSVSVSLRHTVNSTGHPQLFARLDHPEERGFSWFLDLDLSSITCGEGESPTRELTLNLYGLAQRRAAPAGYVDVSALGLVRPVARSLTWHEALAACAAEGSALPLPASAPLQEALAALVPFGTASASSGEWAWVGATDLAIEAQWLDLQGTPVANVSSAKWHPGEPNGGTNQNCMVIKKSVGLLADAPCNWKLPFACYMPK